MKPVHVSVVLFDPTVPDPATEGEFPVFEGVEVDIAVVSAGRPEEAEDVLRLAPDPVRRQFIASGRSYKPGRGHYFRVSFAKRNFSKQARRLLSSEEVTEDLKPVSCPSRVPVWDSGLDDGYRTNEFFGDGGVLVPSTPDHPLVLRVPLRRVYVIGHRGAPHSFPENTLASFRQALDVGANALEFDLCLTKDKRIVVFHDSKPDKARVLFETFPFELVSPEFDGDLALIKELKGGAYRIAKKKRMRTGSGFDILKLTVQEVRRWYRYHHVDGVEHPIPDLDEFLAFASAEVRRLKLLFFDVKSPRWSESQRRSYVMYGSTLGRTLRRYPVLPERLVIAHESRKVLEYLKESIVAEGETRCEFAYDAAGSLGAMFGIKKNPLEVAREMNNTVVSVGARFRTGDLEEIVEATRDRDYNPRSALNTVVHWTINEPEQMYYSFAAGVNGIVTDKPDLLAALLVKMGVVVG